MNYKIFHKETLLSSTLWFVVPLLMAFLRFMSWNVEFYIIGLSSYITHPPDMWYLGKMETSKWSLFEQWTENMFVLIELNLSDWWLCFFHEAVIISLKNIFMIYLYNIICFLGGTKTTNQQVNLMLKISESFFLLINSNYCDWKQSNNLCICYCLQFAPL